MLQNLNILSENLKVSQKNAVNMDKRTSDTCRKDYENMGLAASQARFLCLTARKAHCEYKSTALAQEKLNITNQMSQIANDYAQAMNATKLMWCPDGMAGSFGLTYSLLMTPSAANDFDPYLVTTPSGAVVLNTAFKEAAEAAGISKAGGGFNFNKKEDVAQLQELRDKFIAALSAQGVVTDLTAKDITVKDWDATLNDDNSVTLAEAKDLGEDAPRIDYVPGAGMGNQPKIKGGADVMTLADMILSEKIGKKKIDWAKMFVDSGEITKLEYETEIINYDNYINSTKLGDFSEVGRNIIYQFQRDMNEENKKANSDENKIKDLEKLISYIHNYNSSDGPYYTEVDSNGVTVKHFPIDPSTNQEAVSPVIRQAQAKQLIIDQLKLDKQAYIDSNNAKSVKVSDEINVKENSIRYEDNDHKTYSIVVNGVINHYESEIEGLTLGDVLSQEVVLMAGTYMKKKLKSDGTVETNSDGTPVLEKCTEDESKERFKEDAIKILGTLSAILGYSPNDEVTNIGLNVDDASSQALKFAYMMTKNTYLNINQIQSGSRYNKNSMTDNSAYTNAVENNRIGASSGGDKALAVSLTGMMNAFLTYYENALSGAASEYVVGISRENSVLVTNNAGYQYIANELTEELTMAEKNADFFDELFNNIIEHGWRYDSSIDDSEYLETVLKNGRYSMCSLNPDGYYYQTRYNETGYMDEVIDTDAIARAEAEFTAKKAELTYKEDTIEETNIKELSTINEIYIG